MASYETQPNKRINLPCVARRKRNSLQDLIYSVLITQITSPIGPAPLPFLTSTTPLPNLLRPKDTPQGGLWPRHRLPAQPEPSLHLRAASPGTAAQVAVARLCDLAHGDTRSLHAAEPRWLCTNEEITRQNPLLGDSMVATPPTEFRKV